MRKIGIVLTSIERDLSLFKAIQSILENLQDNWMVIIGYQSKNKTIEFSHPQFYSYELPYNCGISYARNDLIQKSAALGCEYTLLSADSILFNESMKDINNLLPCFQKSEQTEWSFYDLIGLQIHNRIEWEAKLKLIPEQSFELDFIEKVPGETAWLTGDLIFDIWPCDITRNFWLARTDTLLKVPYDEQLIMAEHEDFFWRYKQAGYKVGWTNLCAGSYNKDENTKQYDEIRSQNFRIGKQRLLEKYKLKSWVSYKHLERVNT